MKRVKEIFRKLPRVPRTKYLENRLLSEDMLYNGYRPILYPMRENPLLNHGNVRETHYYEKPRTHAAREEVNELLYGPGGNGGISTLGVRTHPDTGRLLIGMSYSIMGMEYYPEWENVPHSVMKQLKPYDIKKKK